jgi:4-hydroxybutyrate dehydrogenase
MALITYLTRVEFEEGAIAKLPSALDGLSIRNPLLVTDQGLMRSGLIEAVMALLKTRPIIFADTPANPTERAVDAAFALYGEAGCDGIVAIGGGSSIDLAKAVRLLTGHAGPLGQYAAVAGGMAKIHGDICPLVAVPTTSGTGSEVGRAAVIVTHDGRKLGIISPFMLPSLALCDPELTYGLPPQLTAATGMDALAHCLETFMAPAINPPADAIAIDGLKRGWGAITTAVAEGHNRPARWEMMMCALEGAMAFQKGLGAVHALSHPMGASRDLHLHHGTLNAVLLPAVLRFNRAAIGPKWGVLAELLGGEPDQVVRALATRIGMPPGLSAMGMTEAMMDMIASQALDDHCHATNPRIATRDDYRQILAESR